MQPKLLKYILDIESIIQEIEQVKTLTKNNFIAFKAEILYQRAIERDLEIIGEAIRKMFELDSSIQISSAKNIIGLRNIISHAYDSVEQKSFGGLFKITFLFLVKRSVY